MRTAFIQELIAQARLHPDIFLVVGDLGYSVVEPFAKEFPDRFLNAGVAEQNMTGIAAGLASEGYHVFTYSIANFPTLRCLEQIRNDICYHNLAVTIVAVGAGLAYGNLGYSHHGVQDIAAMRGLPGMCIASPADPNETRKCLSWILNKKQPSYLRLGKAGEPVLYESRQQNELTDFAATVQVQDGNGELAICATGSVLKVALAAAEQMRTKNVYPSVFSIPILSPVDTTDFEPLWRKRNIVTLEEHVLAGGMGSLLRECAPDGVRIRSLCVDNTLSHLVGSQQFLWQQHGITVANVEKTCYNLLEPSTFTNGSVWANSRDRI
jgi:transketolase